MNTNKLLVGVRSGTVTLCTGGRVSPLSRHSSTTSVLSIVPRVKPNLASATVGKPGACGLLPVLLVWQRQATVAQKPKHDQLSRTPAHWHLPRAFYLI
jgi:hypothetical protein